MASEIQVQTISGPPTGANANKIIIPAGQTLDASAGNLERTYNAGEVIQGTEEIRYNTLTVTTATNPSSGEIIGSPSLVAKRSNTRLRIAVRMVWWHYDGWDGVASVGLDVNGTNFGNYDAFTSIIQQPGIRYNSVLTFRNRETRYTDSTGNFGTEWSPQIDNFVGEMDITNNIGDTINTRLVAWNSGASELYINRAINVNTNYHGAACGCSVQLFEVAK